MSGARTIIVAMTSDGVIGLNGTVPWHYSADLKRFKRLTLHSTIIMGRNTWESLPYRPLSERRNIVITSNPSLETENYPSIEEALSYAQDNDIWFIGGATIYTEAIQHCDRMYVTYVPDKIDDPNCVRFPPIDWKRWVPKKKVRYEDDERLYFQEFTIKNAGVPE